MNLTETEAVVPATHVSEASVRAFPNLRSFQKGVSGNPGGKPKGEDVRALARKNTKRAMERIVELIDDADPRVAIMAAKEVLDRAYGKPKVIEDDEGGNGKNLTINILRYTDVDATTGVSSPAVQIRTITDGSAQNPSRNPKDALEVHSVAPAASRNDFAP